MKYDIIFKSGKIKNVVSKDVNKIKNYITESFNNINSVKRLDENEPTKASDDKIKQAQEKLDNALARLAYYKKEKLDYASMDEYEKEEFKEEYQLAKYDVDMAKQELNELKNK